MIAEIYGKVENHMEDELTGNVFGTLRYTPFNKILKPLLKSCVRPKEIAAVIDKIDCEFWGDKIQFWSYDKQGEIDLLLTFDAAIIGIEMKFLSGLSGEDQLQREAEIVARKAGGREKILLLMATEGACLDIVTPTEQKNFRDKYGVNLGYIAWEKFFDALKTFPSTTLNPYEKIIVDDLTALLTRKSFDSFRSFDVSNVADIFIGGGYFEFGKGATMTAETCKNIMNAAAVITKTHENVDKFLTHCKNLAKDERSNYDVLTERFLRWSTDVNYLAWVTTSFILLFKRKDTATNTVYGLEVNLDDASVKVAKYVYEGNFDYATRISPADHWKYEQPFWKFGVNVEGNYKKVDVPPDTRLNNLRHVIFVEIPFTEITDKTVDEKIFGTFEKLATM